MFLQMGLDRKTVDGVICPAGNQVGGMNQQGPSERPPKRWFACGISAACLTIAKQGRLDGRSPAGG